MFKLNENNTSNENHILSLQRNNSERDYVYEISVQYLIARAIHVACELQLNAKIPENGINIDDLIMLLPGYDKSAIIDLITLLASYQIFKVGPEGIFYNTVFSNNLDKVEKDILEDSNWIASYDVVRFLNDHPQIIHHFQKHKASLKDFTLTYQSPNPDSIVLELALGHIVSRAIRIFSELNLYDVIVNSKKILESDLLAGVTQDKKNQIEGWKNILSILSRYNIINYHTGTISATKFTEVLTTNHFESIHPAMLTIDKKWYGAASLLRLSLQIDSKSAFEQHNDNAKFYDIYDGSSQFSQGMAAISINEDRDVAKAISSSLANYTTIVDIGGGDAGLLGRLHEKFRDNKKYVLFEKEQALQNLQIRINKRFTNNFMPEIVLGDFSKSSDATNIPKYDNAAYIVKCVLHNIKDSDEIIKILSNIKAAMGANCQLFLAERIVPKCDYPHLNRSSNLLMRLLFKASSRDISFYNDCLMKSGFNPVATHNAGNYVVMQSLPTPKLSLAIQEYGIFPDALSKEKGVNNSRSSGNRTNFQPLGNV